MSVSVPQRKEAILPCPGQQDWFVKQWELPGGLQRIARRGSFQYFAEITTNRRVPSDRVNIGCQRLRRDRILGQPPVRDWQALEPAQLQQLPNQKQKTRNMRSPMQWTKEQRRKGVVGIAIGEHNPTNPFSRLGHDNLTECTSGIIGYQRCSIQIKRRKKVGKKVSEYRGNKIKKLIKSDLM